MPDRTQQPPIHPFGQMTLTYPEPRKLQNGIPVYCIGSERQQLVRISVYVAGGTFDDTKPMLSLFTASLALEACSGMTPQQVNEAFDYYGAWKQAKFYDRHCQLTLAVPSEKLRYILPIFGNCVLHPVFPEQELELSKHMLASNLANARQQVRNLAQEEARRLYYGLQHPLGHTQLVLPEHIMAVGRDDLIAFHKKYYRPANCRIVISGHCDDQVLTLLNHTFGQWDDTRHEIEAKPFIPATQPDNLSIIDKPGALQAAIIMVIPAIPRQHPDYFRLRMVITALGGYFGSRLETDLREAQGLTYGISAMLLGHTDEAHIGIITECDTGYVQAVIDGVKHHIGRLKTELLPQAELSNVKQYMLGELAKTLDTPFSIAGYVANSWLNGLYPSYFNDQVKAIANATAADLRVTAQRYLDTNQMQITLAGDKKAITQVLHDQNRAQ